MTHYWGAQAIVKRLGYKAANRLPDFIARYRIPAFKRIGPNRIPCYYSNEELLTRWELTQAQEECERIKAHRQAKQEAAGRVKKHAFSK